MAKKPASPSSSSGDAFDVLIAGGGPVGLTLALALARRGFTTALADAGPAKIEGRAFLVAAGCWRIWRALGVEAELLAHAEPVTSVEAGSGPSLLGSGGIAFLSSDSAAEATELGYMIEEGPLNAALRVALGREEAATIFSPVRIGAPEVGDAWAQVDAGGRTLKARLVVGCDGVRSAIRQAAGIRFSGRDYPAKALSTVLKLDSSHHGAARQVFLPTGPVAALPLKDNRVNLVWSHRAAVADALAAMSDADFVAELARATDGFLDGFRLDGARHAFPLGVHVADRLHGPRIALAGDAAHQIHPLAGQGLNLGLKDVAALVDVIAEADRVGLDIGSEGALAPYTKWRRPDIVAQAAAMDGFAMAFTGPAPVRALAGLGMAAAGQAPMLRRAFAREAAGEGGETPSLMRA